MCAKKAPAKSRTDPRLYWPKRCLSLCKAVCPRWREGVALDAGQCHMLAGWSITTSCCNCPSTRTVSCTQHNNAAQIVAVKQIWYSYCMPFLFFNHCHKMCIFVCCCWECKLVPGITCMQAKSYHIHRWLRSPFLCSLLYVLSFEHY